MKDHHLLYEVSGEASSALAQWPHQETPQDAYNRCVLEQIVTSSSSESSNLTEWLRGSLLQVETQVRSSSSASSPGNSSRKRQRQLQEEWILIYNRGLGLLTVGQVEKSMDHVWDNALEALVDEPDDNDSPQTTPKTMSQPLLAVACKLGFLYLEGFLILSAGDSSIDASSSSSSTQDTPLQHLSSVLTWLALCIDAWNDPQGKFLWSLYTARLEVGSHDTSSGKLVEAKIRVARKELKQAMEIFQHKLRPEEGGGGAGEGTGSMANESGDGSSQNHNTTSSMPLANPILQVQNQAALNLKANTEQLKGNVKKSLILCSEAAQATDSPTTTTTKSHNYDTLHYNNLALVYEGDGRHYLALHAWSKALKAAQPASLLADGTASLDPTLAVLHNTGLGALKAHNYLAAYDCFGKLLQSRWQSRPKTWLRLAEACLGIWTQTSKAQKERNAGSLGKIVVEQPVVPKEDDEEGDEGVVDVDEASTEQVAKGLVFLPSSTIGVEQLEPILTSPKDMEQVQKNPLLRARAALEQVMHLLEEQPDREQDRTVLVSAQLSLSYVCLEDKNYATALEYAEKALEQEMLPPPSNDADDSTSSSPLATKLFQRQQATARLYASEATCNLARPMDAMRHLVGDGKDDAFDRLARDLSGGITMEIAASKPKGKVRLAQAQARVRACASAVSAELGNASVAKQLARSAQSMEGPMERKASFARKALVYSLLKEGNQRAALTLLQST